MAHVMNGKSPWRFSSFLTNETSKNLCSKQNVPFLKNPKNPHIAPNRENPWVWGCLLFAYTQKRGDFYKNHKKGRLTTPHIKGTIKVLYCHFCQEIFADMCIPPVCLSSCVSIPTRLKQAKTRISRVLSSLNVQKFRRIIQVRRGINNLLN